MTMFISSYYRRKEDASVEEQQARYIYKGYKYRIYPTNKQKEYFEQAFGATRFLYNYFLELQEEHYKNGEKYLGRFDCQKLLTQLKHTEGYTWLNETERSTLEYAIRNLDEAYSRYFDGLMGKPRYHSKRGHTQSFAIRQQHLDRKTPHIRVGNKSVFIPKIGNLRMKVSRPLLSNYAIRIITITKTTTNKYYASILCHEPAPAYEKPRFNSVGIDLGIKTYATMSVNQKYQINIENPHYLEQQLGKLAKEQRKLSRKVEAARQRNNASPDGLTREPNVSKRLEKQRLKVAKIYEKVTNQRKDFLHQLSTSIVRNNHVICVEDLHIQEMLKSKQLSREILDAGWGEFLRMLEYKSDWYSRWFVRIDRFYPSSQICSNCGYQNKVTKSGKIRTWTCPNCGTFHDRDYNASKNIEQEGLRKLGHSV